MFLISLVIYETTRWSGLSAMSKAWMILLIYANHQYRLSPPESTTIDTKVSKIGPGVSKHANFLSREATIFDLTQNEG